MTAAATGAANPDESQPAADVLAGPHPLDSLTADEIRRARAVLVRAGLVSETTRFPLVMLVEPPKAAVLDPSGWPALDRVVETVLLDASTGAVTVTLVSLASDQLISKRQVDVAVDGQPPFTQEEM